MNRTDRLVAAIQKKYGTAGGALRALGFDSALINQILEEEKAMITKRNRLARDELEMPTTPEQAIETIQQIFDGLEDDDAADLATMVEQRLGTEPGAQDGSFRRPGRARDRRLSRDQPPPFPGRPTPGGGTPIGIPDPEALDRNRRARDGHRGPAMDSKGLPSFEELVLGGRRG